MTKPSIETDNLTLVPATVAEMLAQIASLDRELQASVSPEWMTRLKSATDAEAFWLLGFNLVHRSSGAMVGQCGFKGPPSPDKIVELAYVVAREHRGKGYATEAAKALTDFAFASGQVRIVRAHTLPKQNASSRVLTKSGFRHLGEVIDPEDGAVWRWEKVESTHHPSS